VEGKFKEVNDMNIEGFANLTLVGLVALGAVNVISFFKPDMESKLKFGLSFVIAFAVTFVPVELANVVAQNAKLALEAALAASGVYKLATKSGGI